MSYKRSFWSKYTLKTARVVKWIVKNECKPGYPLKSSFISGSWSYVLMQQESEELYLHTSKFDSRDDLVKSVKEFYRSKGYGISIRGSRKGKHVILQCDRGGSYRDIQGIASKRKRATGTRLINCPFKIVGKKCSDGSNGAWTFDVKDLSHNHEPSTDISGHPSCRHLASETIKSVEEMTTAGIPPSHSLKSFIVACLTLL